VIAVHEGANEVESTTQQASHFKDSLKIFAGILDVGTGCNGTNIIWLQFSEAEESGLVLVPH